MKQATESLTTAKRRRGPGDPERRDRIAEAAITVALQNGIDAVTHRSVAAEADVPLGSTTYYFRTIDDLLSAAMEKAAQRSVAHFKNWAASLSDATDLTAELSRYVATMLGEERTSSVVESRLYALANARPALRGVALGWDRALAEVLSKLTDPTTGRILAVMLCGFTTQALLSDEVPDYQDIQDLFGPVVDAAQRTQLRSSTS